MSAGEHRRAKYKEQDSPEHAKHQQEKVAKQLQDLERAKQLAEKRAISLSTPKDTPNKTLTTPLSNTFQTKEGSMQVNSGKPISFQAAAATPPPFPFEAGLGLGPSRSEDGSAGSSDGQGQAATTNKLLLALDHKLDNLSAQMNNLQVSVESRLSNVEARMDANDLRVDKLEQILKDSPNTDVAVVARLSELEKQLAELRAGGLPDTDERSCTAVLGGLGGLSSKEEAEEWFTKALENFHGPRWCRLTARETSRDFFLHGFLTKQTGTVQ